MKTEMKKALAEKSRKTVKRVQAAYMTAVLAMSALSVTAFADATSTGNGVAKGIIKSLLTISKYVGIGIVAFGVYEIAMSFMQQQPEAKTKGITMAIVGAILIGLKSMFDNIPALAGMY